MPWLPWWPRSNKNDDSQDESTVERIQRTAEQAINVTERKIQDVSTNTPVAAASTLRAFTEPSTIAATVILTAACLSCFKLYRTYFRRIPEAINIHQSYFRKRTIFGKVTSVGDGDNFRIFHTPGGWLAGWGWLPWRKVPTDKKLLKNKTIHVRLAGIDAPELPHFGRPAQPYSQEALDWLTSYVLGRRVRTSVYKVDQYSRVVATAYVWKGLLRRDIGLQMLRAGYATVYEAKSGAEFGENLEPKYRSAEAWAKSKKKGMWSGDMQAYESPREYKSRFSGQGSVNERG